MIPTQNTQFSIANLNETFYHFLNRSQDGRKPKKHKTWLQLTTQTAPVDMR